MSGSEHICQCLERRCSFSSVHRIIYTHHWLLPMINASPTPTNMANVYLLQMLPLVTTDVAYYECHQYSVVTTNVAGSYLLLNGARSRLAGGPLTLRRNKRMSHSIIISQEFELYAVVAD